MKNTVEDKWFLSLLNFHLSKHTGQRDPEGRREMSPHLLLSQMNLTTLSFPYKSLKNLSFISTSNHSLPSPSLHFNSNVLLQSPGKPKFPSFFFLAYKLMLLILFWWSLVSGHKFKLTQKPKILPFTTKSSAQVDDVNSLQTLGSLS